MSTIIKSVMITLLLVCGFFTSAGNAYAQISHVSINEQQFILGGYPKFRLNIVSKHESIDKIQFVVRQASGEERLMVKPINNFLLLVSGVEDVLDPNAILVIREYRVNKWRDVKQFNLFNGQKLSPELSTKTSVEHLKLEKSVAYSAQTNTKAVPAKPIDADKPARYRAALIDSSCQLDYTSDMTLWRIGTQQSKRWGISTYGAILAIFEANTPAFIDGKINSLRADVPLKCPSIALREKYADSNMAKKAFESL